MYMNDQPKWLNEEKRCPAHRSAAPRGGQERVKAQSDFPPPRKRKTMLTRKSGLCLSFHAFNSPSGDGGGFDVARGVQGASWKPATLRPGCYQGLRRVWRLRRSLTRGIKRQSRRRAMQGHSVWLTEISMESPPSPSA